MDGTAVRTLIDLAPTVLIWTGLLWAAAVAGWLVFRRGARPFGPLLAFVVPIAFVAAGFATGGVHGWWVVLVSCGVAGLCETARRRFVRGPHLADEVPPVAAALAVVTAAGVLLEFGAMLAVRLVIRPDPGDSFVSGLDTRPLMNGLRALGVPLLGVLALVVLAAVLRRGGRFAAWLWQDSARGIGTWPYREGLRRPGPLGVVVGAALLLLFGLPAVLPGDGLTVGPFATPEYGKLLFLLALATVVTFDSHQVATPRRLGVVEALGQRWVRWPLVLFAVVMAGSAVRHDFGTAVSLLAVAVGVTWSAIRFGMDRLPDSHEGGTIARERRRLRRSLQTFRPFSAIGLLLLVAVGAVGFLATDYVSERAQVWRDPWQYRWDSGCVLVDPAPSGPVDPAATGAPPPRAENVPVAVVSAEPRASAVASPSGPAAPPGWARCQQAAGADEESERSQLARALSAVADGGLWGRGLRDTASSVVPAGSTDFVLVVIWHKLGAVAVLGAAALTVLLGVALPRAARIARDGLHDDRGPTAAELFAAGLGAMIVGQFLFVLAATVNVIPHSGVPAPLLSRGGQSNLVVLVGVAAVLALGAGARRAAARDAAPAWGVPSGPVGEPGPYRGRPAGWFGVTVALALAVAIVTATTALPYWAWAPAGGGPPGAYGDHRPACQPRPPDRDGQRGDPPRPRDCSTDRLAHRRTVIEVRFGDRRALRQWRPQETWRVVADPALGGLTDADLAGLLRVGTGPLGTLDLAYAPALYGSTGLSLSDRLLPHGRETEADPADGGVELTLDPALQHALAATLRAEPAGAEPAGDPLPAGAVVVEVATGHVLAGASAPPQPAAEERDADADRATVTAFRRSTPRYGPVAADGSLDGTVPDRDCAGRPPADPCWRWSIQPQPRLLSERGAADLRRYVGGDRSVRLPDPGVDRAFGRGYALGGMLLPVVAGAYLAVPGNALTDRVPAPASMTTASGRVVRNPPGCRADADGSMTVARALADACGTAFVSLAERLAWSQIADQARRFGMTVGNCREVRAWLADTLRGSAGTCVPGGDPDAAATVADALTGGTDVAGTPLGVATMLAAVANHGARVQPTLVASATSPASGLTLEAPPAQPGTAMSAQAAADVAGALARGGEVWSVTAAADVREPAAGEFARRYVWVAGFTQTARHGTVAFAVVVECGDEQAGVRRARVVLDTLDRVGG